MRNRDRRRTVAATEAAKGFGALVDRVRESRQVYEVESRGQVVAEIGPPRRTFTVADLRALVARERRAPAELIDAIDAARAEARTARPAAFVPLSGRGGRKR
ncbi:MAG: hypothetical protein M3Q55_16185 [Acidobacteriota bacterium]|nr:hypothetical protein [Acidobacteriota bacterium]